MSFLHRVIVQFFFNYLEESRIENNLYGTDKTKAALFNVYLPGLVFIGVLTARLRFKEAKYTKKIRKKLFLAAR